MMEKYDIIRVFPRRTSFTPTDEMAFVGLPPLFCIGDFPVKISVCFTWDIPYAKHLALQWRSLYPDVQIGGPAYGSDCSTFTAGMFVKRGVTFTSRGCLRHCEFCLVPEREGSLIELPIVEGNNIGDNNLLACSNKHINAVFDMLESQKAVIFSGGLDSRLLKPWHIKRLKQLSLQQMFFAADDDKGLARLRKIADMLSDFTLNQKRCYALIGYNNDMESDRKRLEEIYKLGFLPFAQLYRPADREITWPQEWKDFVRYWSRPAIYKSNLL